MMEIYVNQNGMKSCGEQKRCDERDCFRTVQEAVDRAADFEGEPVRILIADGIYHEQVTIRQPDITLEGKSSDTCVITYDLGAYEILDDGIKRGTFRTQSVFIDTHDFCARNITFKNEAGPGKTAGQAIAVYAEGDRLNFDCCRFVGNQDTLFTGPLPPEPYEPGGFRGPKESAPRVNGRQYYRNCYIEGNIDFIFGSATAYFEHCEIFCRNAGASDGICSFITASSSPSGQKYGYIFDHCDLTSDCPEGSCFLGRPWRNYANVVYINCNMGKHINPEGWHDWKKTDAHDTVFFAEYDSSGDGGISDKRAAFSRRLSEEEAAMYSRKNVLGF